MIEVRQNYTVRNPSQSKLVAQIHDVPTPWIYRGANLELVQLVTSAVIVGLSFAALIWIA